MGRPHSRYAGTATRTFTITVKPVIDAPQVPGTATDEDVQRQATGRVVPDSFTHGSAAQRKQWFMTGYQQGTVQACNTFGSGAL